MRLLLPGGHPTELLRHRPEVSAGRSRPAVLQLHGIQSHPGWFVRSAASLASQGWFVFQLTRRGSGRNDRGRGDARSAEQLLDDLAAAVRFAAAQGGGDGRVHLMGISWGGKLAACYAATRGGPLASLTLIAPGIVPQVDLPRTAKAAVAAAMLVAPQKTFPIPLNDPALFTDNEARRREIRDDPLRLHRATARFLYASRRLDRMLARANDGAIAAPTSLLLARRDRIIRNEPTRRLLERLTGRRLRVVEFDAAHTLEFEPDPEPFYAALAEGLRAAEGDA